MNVQDHRVRGEVAVTCSRAASAKSNLSCLSASPWYLLRQSAPLRMKNEIFCDPWLQEFASACKEVTHASSRQALEVTRAIIVFPVPGGPWNRTPPGALIPSWEKISG